MSPYTESLSFIKKHPDTGAGIGLSKLILSLYNGRHSFSLGECVSTFDRERLNLALPMIQDYFENGETAELLQAGLDVIEASPDLMQLSNAASEEKADVRESWRRAQEAKWAAEEALEG